MFGSSSGCQSSSVGAEHAKWGKFSSLGIVSTATLTGMAKALVSNVRTSQEPASQHMICVRNQITKDHRADHLGRWVKDLPTKAPLPFHLCASAEQRQLTRPIISSTACSSLSSEQRGCACRGCWGLGSLGSKTQRRQLPVDTCQAQAHFWVFMDTSVGLVSGRTQDCCGRDTKCLAECIGESEIVSVSAQLRPGCSSLASIPVLNIRHAHTDSCTLGFQIDWEHRLSQKKKLQ